MAEFAINGVAYRSELMDGIVQILVMKRMTPIFSALVTVSQALEVTSRLIDNDSAESEETQEIIARERMMAITTPIAERLAALPDADVKYILDACLFVTKRQTSQGAWVDVLQNGIVQDRNDGRFVTRLTIAWHVLVENYGDMLLSMGVNMNYFASMAPKSLA